MKCDELYQTLNQYVLDDVKKEYPISELDHDLKYDSPINKQVIDEAIESNCAPVLHEFDDEQRRIFERYCQKMEENSKNTMLDTKYEDNNMYAISYLEHRTCVTMQDIMERDKKAEDEFEF